MKKLTESVSFEVNGEIGIITVNNPPVNALSSHVRQGLFQGIKEGDANSEIKALVLHCEGRTFIAGADITEFGKAPAQGIPRLLEVIDAMENCSKPIVAAIHGTALGGGLETAMGCHYRISNSKAKMGQPEVHLGLIPGAGGTVRLPRIMGVEKALDMNISGNPIDANDALAHGLVDEIVEGDMKEQALVFARKIVAEARPLLRVRDRSEKLAEAKDNPELFNNIRKSIARKSRGFKAPEAIIQAVEGAVNLSFDDAMKNEGRLFKEVHDSPESAAQRYFFFIERVANKIPDVPKDTPTRNIEKIGILGAGTMGGGIAMNFLNAGIPVKIVEVQKEALDRGVGIIRKNYENTARKGRLTEADVKARMSILEGSLDMNAFAEVDMVIEAVYEDMDLKKSVFKQLDKICKSGAILASNTSYLDINEIASVTARPQDVIGTHFFSPANVMKLLEIVRGDRSSKDIIATVMALARKIGKVAVLVGVCDGFVGNRMLAARSVESGSLLLRNALPQEIDKVIFDFGFPMGPFAMSDLAGLDIGWRGDQTPDKETNIRHQLCVRNRRGQKTGAGFYDYSEGSRTPIPNDEVEAIIKKVSEASQITRIPISEEDMLKRMIYAMINEAAKILEEGIALRPSDIDVVWVYGYGWPVYRGGPTYFADQIGLKSIVADLERYAKEYGEHLTPSPLLKRLAQEGKGFKDL
ncbi:MAG: enoyl-CoA hydratase/isomerase family protein [SAR324 cluster bacterium]|nr:enoyl-CoA hydratase/isomerase family protein [SAR324 cluster bacterium]